MPAVCVNSLSAKKKTVYGNQIGIEYLAMVNGMYYSKGHKYEYEPSQTNFGQSQQSEWHRRAEWVRQQNADGLKFEGKSLGKISGSNMKASLVQRVTKKHWMMKLLKIGES